MSNDPFSESGAPIDAQFEPAPAAPAPPPKPRGPGWAALAATGFVAALAGAAAGSVGAGMFGVAGTEDVAAAQARLERRINDLAAVQAAIDEKLSQPAAASAELAGLIADLAAVSERLDAAIAAGGDPEAIAALSARLDALEGGPQRGAALVSAELAALTARLASLEAASRAAAEETQAAVRSSGDRAEAALALSAIEAATRRGVGFEADYRVLRRAAPGNADIKRLSPYVSGVTTRAGLQSEFEQVRTAILAASQPETSGRLSWLDRAFGDAVSVRPANGKHPATVKAVETAAAALARGDLVAAVQALSILEGEAARAAEDWTRHANRRITLEAALEDIRLSLADGTSQTP